jgi:hypothetical protein
MNPFCVIPRVLRAIPMVSALVAALSPSSASALRFIDASYLIPKGVVGKPYLHVFELAKGGGSPPYHYKIANNGKLPPGLTLAQEDGQVTGTPLAPGKWSLWVHGIDSGLQHGFWDMQTEREFTFEILPALSIRQQSLDTRTLMLRVARVGIELPAQGILEIGRLMTEAKLTAVGGTAPYTWALAGAVKLPAGLTLDPSRGTIQGTPEMSGSFALTIHVKDVNGSVGITKTTLEIKPASDRKEHHP